MKTSVRKSVTLLESQIYNNHCAQTIFTKTRLFNNDKTSVLNENDKVLSQNEIEKNVTKTLDDLTEPTTCCMSGCANCVWIQYAEKLSNILKENNEDIQKIIMEKVQDPNMRAFLMMELRCRKLIK